MNIPHHLINGSLVINIIVLVPFHNMFFFRVNSNTNIYIGKFFFFFFERKFNIWRPLLIIALYYQIKTPIDFLYR